MKTEAHPSPKESPLPIYRVSDGVKTKTGQLDCGLIFFLHFAAFLYSVLDFFFFESCEGQTVINSIP